MKWDLINRYFFRTLPDTLAPPSGSEVQLMDWGPNGQEAKELKVAVTIVGFEVLHQREQYVVRIMQGTVNRVSFTISISCSDVQVEGGRQDHVERG